MAGKPWILAGLLVVLPAAAGPPDSAQGPAVRVGNATMTLDWYTSTPRWKTQPNRNNAFHPVGHSRKRAGRRTFQLVTLENRYLRLEICPELGGPVVRAVHKPTGQDLFFFEGKAKDWIPFWESGVKANFPFHEHGIRTHDQPASHRIVRAEHGAVTVAMYMTFHRFDGPENRWQQGRFSNMTLSQHVTLAPGEAGFDVTYRIFNAAPWKQGRRFWNDAFFPKHHTKRGVVQGNDKPPGRSDAELIYPVAWISGHNADKLRRFDQADVRVADYKARHVSLFAWDTAGPFAGVWYPAARVNRLRIADPARAPGAKFYFQPERWTGKGHHGHMRNFIELWGGTDHVFEGVENWIDPGEAFELTHRFAMTTGIGRADFANRHAAIALETGGEQPQLQIELLAEQPELVVRLGDRVVARHPATRPGQAVTVDLPAGTDLPARIVLSAGRRVLLDASLPVQIDDGRAGHEAIAAASARTPQGEERAGSAMTWGRHYRNALGARGYPDPSVARGRLLYRDGQLAKAVETLAGACRQTDDPEGWYLLGRALLDLGRTDRARTALAAAVQGKQTCPAAHLPLAVLALGDENRDAARRHLDALLQARPKHWQGHRLRAWIAATDSTPDPQRAAGLVDEDPADPIALWIYTQALAAGGTDADGEPDPAPDRATEAGTALAGLLTEPGAKARLSRFRALTTGRMPAPYRMKKQ